MSFALRSLGVIALAVTPFAGWVNNVIWTFHQYTLVNIALGAVGIFVAPIGAIHGIWLWF